MTVATTRRSAHGLDVGADNRWDWLALCGANPDMWSEVPPGRVAPNSSAARAAHLCNHHCDRLERCLAAARAKTPIEIVQAGKLWTRGEEIELPESGHGPHCGRPLAPQPAPVVRRQKTPTSLPDGDPRHGTYGGYTNHACRCPACRQANRDQCRRRYQRRSA